MRNRTLLSQIFRPLLASIFALCSVATFAQDTINVGTGSTTNGTTSYPCPLQDYYEGSRAQYLYKASELNALGMGAGSISAIKFTVTGLATGDSLDIEEYEIKISTTSSSSLGSSTWESISNTVYGPVDYLPTLGDNYFVFNSSFTWNGTDNILIEICNGDTNNGGATYYTQNYQVPWTTGLSFNGSRTYRSDNSGNLCSYSGTTENGTQTTRPNIGFVITLTSCSGTPIAGSAEASQNLACSVDPVTLSLSGATAALGITYQWQSSPDSSSWTNIAGATNAVHTTTISANTYFRCLVSCNLGTPVASSGVLVQLDGGTTIPYLEDFENVSTIEWNALPNSGYAWYVNSGATGSSSTGPDIDHTLGTSSGNYVYTEASNGSSGDIAILESACVNLSGEAAPLISYWYHMYGSVIDTLWFEGTSDGINWIVYDSLPNQQQSAGAGSDPWRNHIVPVPSNVGKVRFRLTSQGCCAGDASLDDVMIFGADSIDMSIASSQTIFGCGSNDSVSLVLKNLGFTTVTSVPVMYSLNGGSYQSAGTYTGSLALGDEAIFTFPITLGAGSHTIDLVTAISGDANATNDSSSAAGANPVTLTGSYTLGGGSADFTNFTELTTSLSTCGLSGPATVNVLSGTGPFNEQLILENINGLSVFNSLIINGNGETIEYDGVSPDYRIVGFGTDIKHITINDLVIKELGVSTGFGVHFGNGADSNTVNGCIIDMSNCTSASSTAIGIAASGSNTSYSTGTTDSPSYLTISNNQILGGSSSGAYYGITLYGTSGNYGVGNLVTNNIVENTYGYGIYCLYQDALEVSGNDLSAKDRTSSTTKYMIYSSGGLTNADIFNNYIHDAFGGVTSSTSTFAGVALVGVDATSGNENNVYNNIIGNIESSGAQYGLYNSSSNYANFVHNTISLDGSASSTTRGIYLTSTPTNVNMINNIIYTTRPGTSHNIYIVSGTSLFSDHNVLWNDTNSASSYIGYSGGNRAELSNMWAVGYDSNSVQEPPVFADPTNGIFTPLSNAIDDMGMPVGLTFDFYSSSRSLTTPDVGAIEFVGLAGDVLLADAQIIRESLCYGTNDTVRLTITNVLGSTINFANDALSGSWSISGPATSSGTFTLTTGTLGEGQSLTFDLTGANLSIPGSYSLSANLDTNAVNSAPVNDTLIAWSTVVVDTLQLIATPPVTIITNPGDSAYLLATSLLLPAPYRDPFFTEICQFRGASTPPGGWPSYLIADDYIEITGVPGMDLSGMTYEEWSSTTLLFSTTFGAGTLLSPNGTAVFATGQLSTSTPDSANFYYHIGNTTTHSSGTGTGYILKNSGGTIIDAVGYDDGYTFPAASGVTSADWSGIMPNTSGTTGGHLIQDDVNQGSNWGVVDQNPNVANDGITVPGPNDATPGFEWQYLSTQYDTLAGTFVGPFSTSGDTMIYVAVYNSACGLFADSAVVITDFIHAAISGSTDVSCFGGSDGTATAMGSGSVGPYTYLWSDGQTTATATGLSAGIYTVSVYDNDGWPDSATVTISEPTALSNTFTIVPSGCGAANGSATSIPSGGTSGYTFVWSNASTSAAATALSSGTYTVTVTDANGCTLSDAANVSDAGAPSISFAITNIVSCNGVSDGEITASVSGGATPYSYSWFGSSSTSGVASSIGAGTYTLTVTDSLGCSVNSSTSITEPTPLVASSSVDNDVSCNGGTNGGATASASGGTTGYTYAWSNAATTASITGLAANTYTVTVTDAHGCTSTSSSTVTQPSVLSASVSTVSNVSCNGGSDGSLSATPSGGTSGYTYLWSNAQTSATSTGLSASTYTVTVTDANSCTTTATGAVTQPTVMIASISGSNDASCFGFNDGDATAAGSGGTAGYSYAWSSSATSATATGLGAGTYTVTVTDANGCTDVDNVTIGEPTLLVSDIVDSSDATCYGYADGGAEASASGGTSPYTYDWSGSQT
ncbi:MAG: hypothetical protein R2813_07850, partial [Flavobacteriales bacterium]